MMNRREILKFSLLAPIAGLFKSRKSGASTGLTGKKGLSKTDICNEALNCISETTGTLQPGDRVWIGQLPNSMSHFQSCNQATVLYSYRSKYGSSGRDDTIGGVDYADEYALDVDGHGHSAWYPDTYLLKLWSKATGPVDEGPYFRAYKRDGTGFIR